MNLSARFAGHSYISAAFACLLLIAASGKALSQVVLVSNLNQPDSPSPAFINTTFWGWRVVREGNQPMLLNSVTLDVRGGDFAGSFYVTLYSDQSGVPGAPLAGGQLTGPTQPTDFSSFLPYSAAQSLVLAPNTRYWAVASSTELGTDGQSYGMFYVSELGSTTFTSDYGWQLPVYCGILTGWWQLLDFLHNGSAKQQFLSTGLRYPSSGTDIGWDRIGGYLRLAGASERQQLYLMQSPNTASCWNDDGSAVG